MSQGHTGDSFGRKSNPPKRRPQTHRPRSAPTHRRLSVSRISRSRCLWRSRSLCSLILSKDKMSLFSLLSDLRS